MMCRDTATFVCIATTCWLFLIFQTASSPLKDSIQARDMLTVTGPFVNKYIYADKTHLVQKLCERDGGRYFFVRPRRFGKSTFLATLHRVFNGSKDIFEGTHIYNHPNISWDRYPILYLDLGNDVAEDDETCNEIIKTRSQTLLEKKLGKDLGIFKANYSLSSPKESRLSDEFASMLMEMNNRGESTVVLIDEYDFSLLNNLHSCPEAEQINRAIVRGLFLQIKDKAACIKFAFVTGISKAVFSTLGSLFDLDDITDNPDFHDIAGLTESDLNKYYNDHIEETRVHFGGPRSDVMKNLTDWYDGYKFHSRPRSSLYNPLSINSYFKKKEAKGYWADKGHAKFLYSQMINRVNEFMGLNLKNGVRSYLIGGTSLNTTDPVLLLYDAGYLTIQSAQNGFYQLGFPNKEMEEAFYRDIADAAKEAENGTGYEIRTIGQSLRRIPPAFLDFINALDTAIMKVGRLPFEEWYDYQIMKLIRDANEYAERQTRINTAEFGEKIIDVTGYTENTNFVFEIKFNRPNNFDAWAAINKSIKTILNENKGKKKPFEYVLAAGITFTEIDENHSIQYYQAKLFKKNGKVIMKYQSENLWKSQSEKPSTKKPLLFLRDDLFEESSIDPDLDEYDE